MTSSNNLAEEMVRRWRESVPQHVGFPSPADVVLDTNVMMDLWQCSDLFDLYNLGAGSLSDARTLEATWRRARVRESCILAWLLQRDGVISWALHNEIYKVFTKNADPADVHNFKTHFATWFTWFVKEYVLCRWTERTFLKADEGLKGNQTDDLLVEICRLSGAALITNEGYTKAGIVVKPGGIRDKAVHAGVRVFAPREYWRGKIGEGAACRAFLQAFDRERPKFLRRYGPKSPVINTLSVMRGYYRHVFFGHSDSPAGVVSLDVKLPFWDR